MVSQSISFDEETWDKLNEIMSLQNTTKRSMVVRNAVTQYYDFVLEGVDEKINEYEKEILKLKEMKNKHTTEKEEEKDKKINIKNHPDYKKILAKHKCYTEDGKVCEERLYEFLEHWKENIKSMKTTKEQLYELLKEDIVEIFKEE